MFSFGDAPFLGSMGGTRLNQPIVGMAATPDGGGYWLVAADGGIFAFGDAHFYGSTAKDNLPDPVVGMFASPDGGGYTMSTANGVVFAMGDAKSFGQLQLDPDATPSTGGLHHERVPKDLGCGQRLIHASQESRSLKEGHPRRSRGLARGVLHPEQLQMIGRRPDEHQAGCLHLPREVGIFG